MTIQSINPTTRRFEIGTVLSNMGAAIGQNPLVFFGLAALLQGLPAAVVGAFQVAAFGPSMSPFGFTPSSPQDVFRILGVTLLGLMVIVITSNVLQAALTFGVVASLQGRKASFAECLAGGLRYFVTALLIGLMVGIVVFVVAVFTFWLLFVPAIFLALIWAVSVPAAVAENKGPLAAMARSAGLTDRYRIWIFLLGVIYWGVYWVVAGLATGIAAAFMQISYQAYLIAASVVVSPLLASIIAVFGAAGTASTYYELRQVKEGIGAQDLARVFE